MLLFDDDVIRHSRNADDWTDAPTAFAKSLIDLRPKIPSQPALSDAMAEAVWRITLLSAGMLDFDIFSSAPSGRSILMMWLDNTLEVCSVRGNAFGEYDSVVLDALLSAGADPYVEDATGTNAFGLWKMSGVHGAMPRSYIDWRETLPIFARHVDLCNNQISGRNGSAVESLVRFAWPQMTVLDDLERVLGREPLRTFKSKKGFTLLFLACYELDLSGVEWTTKKLFSDPNAPSLDGLSPLHAVSLGLRRFADSDEKAFFAMQIAERLVSLGANPMLRDINGKSPSEYAENENLRIFLEKAAFFGKTGVSGSKGKGRAL